MTKRVIYFDFDRTLLDTDALKEEQALRVARITNLSVAQVSEGMRTFVEKINHLDFTPEGYALHLADLYGINPSDVLKIYLTDANYIHDFLFPEVISVLRTLKKQGYSLGIFSGAVPGHQLLKIEKTGILEYIDKAPIIQPRKLAIEAIELLPNEIYVVDDDLEVIEKLQRHFPRFRPVWCNRKDERKHPKVPTIRSLKELLPIISEKPKNNYNRTV